MKVKYKPGPIMMMGEINKWCSIITLILLFLSFEGWSFALFLWEHPGFSFDLFVMSVVSGFGQFFVYRMIKQFKQHFVPFTISSRKILSVSISIVFYRHETNWIQMIGIFFVLSTILMEFLLEISGKSLETKTVVDVFQFTEEIPHEA